MADYSVSLEHVESLFYVYAKLSGAVYCSRSCLWRAAFVCVFVCVFVGLLLR